jgi:hypothetical protein
MLMLSLHIRADGRYTAHIHDTFGLEKPHPVVLGQGAFRRV